MAYTPLHKIVTPKNMARMLAPQLHSVPYEHQKRIMQMVKDTPPPADSDKQPATR